MRTLQQLTDAEIKKALDDVNEQIITVDTVRVIIEVYGVIDGGYVVSDAFASLFAQELLNFVMSEDDTEEWKDDYAMNFLRGVAIAVNLNGIISLS